MILPLQRIGMQLRGEKKERCPIFHFDHGILMRNMYTINLQWNITIYSFKTVPTNCGVPRSLHPSHLHEQSVDAQAYSCFTGSLWRQAPSLCPYIFPKLGLFRSVVSAARQHCSRPKFLIVSLQKPWRQDKSPVLLVVHPENGREMDLLSSHRSAK